jgi:hypothetical protein
MTLKFLPSWKDDREEEFIPKKYMHAFPLGDENEFKKVDWKYLKEIRNIYFIDGVRRTELRVHIFEKDKFLGEGIFISLSAGYVKINTREKNPHKKYVFKNFEVKRLFIHNIEEEKAIPKKWSVKLNTGILHYESVKAPFKDISKYANYIMALLERRTMQEILQKENFNYSEDFIVMDGPVKFPMFKPFLGFIVKNFNFLYTPAFDDNVFMKLKTGEQSSYFIFEEEIEVLKNKTQQIKKIPFRKAGVYIKLFSDRTSSNIKAYLKTPFDSIARIELPYDKNHEEEIKNTLNKVSAIVMKFSNNSLRDPRAPQNITPIASLEKFLRRYLGDYRLLRRFLLASI